MSRPRIDFSQLTPEQRLDLIGQLWDSLDPAPEPGAEQRAELERRSHDLDANPDTGIPAADAIAHLRARLT
ncbi:MAG: addiction module protein [Gemmatimonadales bacterium]